MKSQVVRRTIVVGGRKTTVTLEEPFWNGLREIAHRRAMPLPDMVTKIDDERQQSNLSSAIRLFVLSYYRNQIGRAKRRDKATDVTQPRMKVK